MSEIKNGGLDQYGAGPFEQQQFGTAGVEGAKYHGCRLKSVHYMMVGHITRLLVKPMNLLNTPSLMKVLLTTFDSKT